MTQNVRDWFQLLCDQDMDGLVRSITTVGNITLRMESWIQPSELGSWGGGNKHVHCIRDTEPSKHLKEHKLVDPQTVQ